MPLFSRGYALYLNDNNKWWVTGNNDIIHWVDELAGIMELKESEPDGLSRLIFTAMSNDNKSSISEYFNADDPEWLCHDQKTLRIWRNDNVPDVICEVNNEYVSETRYINMWYSLTPIYWRNIQYGGLPFHSALAELDGYGVLIAASGNTGKSTCCRRLPDYWKPLCDDESLIVLNTERYFAHPFPTWSNYLWKNSGSTWDVQYSVPIRAIFFLEQSKTDEVIPLRMGESASYINESSVQVCHKFLHNIDKESKIRLITAIFNNACEIAKNIPAFRLCASLHGNFWEEIEKVIR